MNFDLYRVREPKRREILCLTSLERSWLTRQILRSVVQNGKINIRLILDSLNGDRVFNSMMKGRGSIQGAVRKLIKAKIIHEILEGLQQRGWVKKNDIFYRATYNGEFVLALDDDEKKAIFREIHADRKLKELEEEVYASDGGDRSNLPFDL